MWQCDEDINSVQGPGAYTTVVGATASYGVFLDAYPWAFGAHGNGFATRSSCMDILRVTEARSEFINSPVDWRFYRRWRSGEKAKMWDERYLPKPEGTGGSQSDVVPLGVIPMDNSNCWSAAVIP